MICVSFQHPTIKKYCENMCQRVFCHKMCLTSKNIFFHAKFTI